MTEEEDDYMSDKFLNESLETNDIRPGLLHSNKQKRELELYKKKQEASRSFKEIAEEKTKRGLSTAIPETNKGFELLKKMGYKPGSGIGKSGDGRNMPISVELKEDKSGLGLESHITEKQQMLKQTSYSAYRAAIRMRKEMSDLKYDYGRIRRACQHFDERDDLKAPIKKWFWPEEQKAKKIIDVEDVVEDKPNDDDDDDEEDEDAEKPPELFSVEELKWRIEQIAKYLREKYIYCIWCGFQFDDEKDISQGCPGRTRELHEIADGTSQREESDE